MHRFIVFWKKDIINKLIVLISLLLTAGIFVFLYLIFNMPEGKSLVGAISEIIPLPSTATPEAQFIFTNTPEATITTMAFNFIAQTPTPIDTDVPPTLVILPSTPPTLSLAFSIPTQGLFTSTPSPDATPIISINKECIPNHPAQTGKVVDIIDGNTIKVLINDLVYIVRYIGVAAPEDNIYSQTAKMENAKLVFKKEVSLITDVSDKDPRGRLLRYVMVGDNFVNLDLIRQGLASALDIPPDSSCAQIFEQVEQSAVKSQLGKWGANPTAKPSP